MDIEVIAFGEVVETVISGPYLYIDPQAESALQDYLAERGVKYHRNDDLINKLACWS